jgi:hypothetical protein
LPVYDLSAAAYATDFDLKQLDNLLSRNSLPGVEKQRRGVARRLTPDTIMVIRLAKELADALRTSVGAMLAVAYEIERTKSDEVQLGSYLALRIDRAALKASTLSRLDSAVEIIGRRPRGRPSRQRTTG